ncbi:hypothetical protein [Streptomyces sp. OE57]|uniref:hypothetical protein n=1 Tax=Streptomyces lacaronensis TaxID=3379885 RepID=UPI0039B73822
MQGAGGGLLTPSRRSRALDKVAPAERVEERLLDRGNVPRPLPRVLSPAGLGGHILWVLVLRSALGLDADVPGGTVTVAPAFAGAYAPLTVTGLQVGGARLDITPAADGTVNVTAPEGLAVISA